MLNKVQLIGNLGSKPELSYVEDQAFISFRLATNRKYKNKQGEVQTETQWHTIRCWGKLAELANKYLKKGQLVFIEGRIQSRSYKDEEGKDRFFTDIIASEFLMLDHKKDAETKKENIEEIKNEKTNKEN